MPETPASTFFQQAAFLTSAPSLRECPPDQGIEIAFAGRSNAGKSSCINTLTRQNKLARASKTPGRTRLINFFRVTDEVRLVDLPGYGYARVDQATKQQWDEHLEEYLRLRQCLRGLVLLMDIRHPLKDLDRSMVEWAVAGKLPVHIVLTKSDKLKRGPSLQALQKVRKDLLSFPGTISLQLFSSLDRSGTEELAGKLAEWASIPQVQPQ